MLGHGGSSASSYLADPIFPHPLALCCHYPVSKCHSASIVVTGTVRVNFAAFICRLFHEYLPLIIGTKLLTRLAILNHPHALYCSYFGRRAVVE